MKRFRKLKWTLLFLLFGMVANVNGQVNWGGTSNGATIQSGQTVNAKLVSDLVMNGIIVVQGNLTIDLNGYVIRRNNHAGYLCVIGTNGTLTLKDSRPNVPHYGVPKVISMAGKNTQCLWHYDASYTASTPGAIRIDGGIMTAGYGFIGGGVCCYGQLIMNGGTIAGNNVASCDYYEKVGSSWVRRIYRPTTCDEMRTAWEGFVDPHGCYKYIDINNPETRTVYNQCMGEGGGVFVGPQGGFTMNGGRICYNYSSFHGGGVYVGGPFIMKGNSQIDNNYAAAGYGAGVFISHDVDAQPCVNGISNSAPYIEDKGTMTMDNGRISYNNSYGGSGGGIMAWFRSTLTINNGTIDHNLALGQRHKDLGNGGGVYCENATFEGRRVVITDNECARNGGGLVVYNNSHLDMTHDSCIIARNIARPRTTDIWHDVRIGSGGGLCLLWKGSTAILGSKVVVFDNEAQRGGGAWISGAECTLRGAVVRNNSADVDGGGFYIYNSSTTTVEQNSKIINNVALTGRGGGLFIQATDAVYTQTNSEISNNTAGTYGGGVFMNTGEVQLNNSKLRYNKANTANGGGIYAGPGTITVDNTVLYKNKAPNGGGGGIYANLGSAGRITIKNNSIMCKNEAKDGGGLYTNSGTIDFQGGTIGGNTASASGGGVYANYPVNLSGGIVGNNLDTIGGNTAVNGGGIYANSNVTMIGGRISGNAANNGGGLYVGNGDITLSGAKVSGNSASNGQGGGIYAGNGNILVKDDTQVGTYSAKAGSGNSAREGGGLYVNGGTVVFTNGTFADNYASEKGGGIYIKEGATLNLRETATLTRNHVPATGQGGGVYMNGTLNVGENAADPASKHKIVARDNYASDETNPTITPLNRNNVFLPSDTKYITLLSDIHASNSKVGFSVTRGFCPVIYTDIEGGNASHEQWLYDLLGSTSGLTGAIFDDAQHYFALHVRHDQGPFEAKYDYLWGAWTTWVNKDPNLHTDDYPLPTGIEHHYTEETDGWHIYTREGLAWFISYVNGLNGCEEHHSANAFMENDVDMSGNLWVPIGGTNRFLEEYSIFEDGGEYKGNFDGQGHVIRNLDCRYLNAVLKIGMFGNVTGGSIKNTFVDGYEFTTQFDDKAYYLGGIAGRALGGVISNCEARGIMSTDYCVSASSYMGGLVGMVDGATVHSSMAMPTMSGTARHMGGLVGQLNANNTLKNSFSNAEITRNDANSQIGGLVGTNLGTVENCYVRLRGTAPSNFGWFAGSNSGTIDYCYAPTQAAGVQTGTNGNYGDTDFVIGNGKYGYAHQDQDVTATNNYKENGPIDNQGELKGLLATLNNWVEAQPATAGYSTWTRTMASPINADLPILEFDDFVSAGSTDNIFIAYKDDLNDMIDYANANSTGGSVYLYDATPTAVNKNTNGNVRVYIAPNVGITQADGNTINARVGVTLDNSSTDFMAYDWHMFSSALATAPMGVVYPTSLDGYHVYDNYGTYQADGIPDAIYNDPIHNYMEAPPTSWNTTAGSIGYFPTNTAFGAFDFYCYEEGLRHWINFKRQGHSGFYDHWHQDVDENGMHQNIGYPNEDDMEVGKGYMVAITAPSMLMTDGVLNNGATSRTASYTAGGTYDYPLRGFNLVGNPYQSYLDFNQFANDNGIDTYYILDADAKGYIAYTTGSTPQQSEWIGGLKGYTASRYIHPHQGFFVRVDAAQPISFNSDMRKGGTNTSSVGSDYRDWEPRYALVNMVCTDGKGRNDFATIELDRPEQGGGRKAKGLRSGDASIWFRLGDEDYQIAFAPVGTQSAPLRFEAHTDGAYTLRWNMQNADFSYLHLIDNLTGTDIDCLTTDEYRFEAKTSDYTSRFRLVFEFTGVEENDEPTEGPSSFAFMMGDELIVNGEGVLQMFDLNGRQLLSTEIHGTQASVALPKVADGIYVLRLTDGNQVRTQKMVINK